MADVEFEGCATAEDGNVRVELSGSGEGRIAFTASPAKVKSLANMLLRVASEAEEQMPNA